MNNLNSILIEGNLVRDADYRTTPKGTPVCKFSIATNRFYKQENGMEKEVGFFEVESWGKRGVMSHTTIYFLTQADNLEQAESRVNSYLDSENFFDYSGVEPDLSGPLETKRKEIDAFLNGWNWKEAADALLKEAEGYKVKGNFGMYGYNLIRAGELYSQNLNIDTYVFNIDTADYSIPEESKAWWAVAVDFHY